MYFYAGSRANWNLKMYVFLEKGNQKSRRDTQSKDDT